ncbi:MAG TPA: hypothetical protein VFQ61_39075, partial [Polyangiaceae bacterium]|nr:hypothetical protein [Polyangiaceae bacterium]
MRRAALICGTGVCLLSGLACTGTHGNPAPILGRVPHSVSGTSASPAAKAVREPDGAWGIPNFFELGSAVRTEQSEVAVDTTAWLQALSNRDERTPAAYLNALHAPRNKVLIYPEQDGLGRTRRFALVLPEQRTFSQNDAVRAYWGRSAEFLSFAVGAAHSAGTVLMGPGEAARAVTLRSLLEPSGVNAQEFENSYQLEGTSRDVHEHKGLVPGLPVAFAEFAFVERASHVREPGKELLPTTDPSGPVAQAGVSPALILTFAPLNHGVWRELSSASVGRHRVLVMSNDEGEVYFVAAPLALAPSWHFGAMGRDLVAQAGPLPDPVRARDQPAAILLLPRATRARLFSGKVKSSAEIGGLLDQAEHFVDGAARARDQLDPGASSTVIRHYARALLETHRSRLDARLLTRFQYGDVEQPINASGGAGAIRFTSDQAAALRALAHSYRRTRDPELLTSLRGLALASLAAIGPGGTIVDRRFDQMALLGNSDPKTARADAQIDNGGVAVTFNHRNLIFARGQDHLPGFTWGSLRLDSAANMLLDGETDEFAIDANSIPRTVDPAQSSLEISRWFSSKHVRARETARVIRGLPAARISYMLEPRTRHGSEPLSANVTLGDFLDYGSGNNEAFQNRFGLSRVIGGAPLPVAFWMEGAEAPLWGDNSPSGLVDVTNEMKRLHPRFVAVYAYDRAALFYFTKLPDQLFLRNVQGGMAGSYHGFTSLTARYEIPAANDGQRTELSPVYGYTLWAPLYSEDDDGVPDQLQQLGKVWANTIEDHERGAGAVQGHSSLPEGDCCANPLKNAFYLSLQSDTGYADLQYAWALVSDLLAEAA